MIPSINLDYYRSRAYVRNCWFYPTNLIFVIFLHRHGVLETDAYSVFDDMQDFSVEHSQVLNLKDIEWDNECEFIYSPFAILVQKKGRPYAQVEHGVEGFISDIQYFNREGQRSERFIMDDRGLVSSVIYFKDNMPYYQDY